MKKIFLTIALISLIACGEVQTSRQEYDILKEKNPPVIDNYAATIFVDTVVIKGMKYIVFYKLAGYSSPVIINLTKDSLEVANLNKR